MRVALEEHFILPALLEYLAKGMPRVSRVSYDRLIEKLFNFGEQRLTAMDGAGVSVAVLSVSGPGVQAERDANLDAQFQPRSPSGGTTKRDPKRTQTALARIASPPGSLDQRLGSLGKKSRNTAISFFAPSKSRAIRE
jgi:hypothetical protein